MRFARLVLFAGLLAAAPFAAAEFRDPETHFFHPFFGDLKAELAEARTTGKSALLVMFHFDDCPACQRMKKNVLSRPDVQAFYRQRFLVVPLDIRGSVPVTDFDGKTWEEKEWAKTVGIRGTPTFIFYGFDGRPAYRQVGEVKDPADFMLLGEYVASGHHAKQTFAQYKQDKARKGS